MQQTTVPLVPVHRQFAECSAVCCAHTSKKYCAVLNGLAIPDLDIGTSQDFSQLIKEQQDPCENVQGE